MATIGFIGLGIMGGPMAANLVKNGHQVRGYSRTPSTRDALSTHGVESAVSVDEAVRGADVVITMLPDTPDVETVALSEHGIIHSIKRGAVYIDMSTIDPEVSRALHGEFANVGVAAVDAPVSGGEAAAIEGSLSIMVGGDQMAFNKVKDILSAMGHTIVRVGDAGAGQSVKAANQLMVAGHLQMLAEALVFLNAQGVEPAAALDVIAGGLAGSTVINRKREAYLQHEYVPGFRVELHHKDLGIVQRTARESGIALPLTASVSVLMQALVAQGDGGLDHSALYKLTSAMNGQPA